MKRLFSRISAATQLKSRADKAHLRQIARRAETTSGTGSPVVRRSLRRWRESQFWQLASIITAHLDAIDLENILCEINPNRRCLLDAWLLSVDVRRRQHFGAPPRTVAVLLLAAVGQTELTSARKPNSVLFDINRAVSRLLDQSVPPSLRALRLYLLGFLDAKVRKAT
jgi:hypothetical protein